MFTHTLVDVPLPADPGFPYDTPTLFGWQKGTCGKRQCLLRILFPRTGHHPPDTAADGRVSIHGHTHPHWHGHAPPCQPWRKSGEPAYSGVTSSPLPSPRVATSLEWPDM